MNLDRILLAIEGNDGAAFQELYDAYGSDLRYGVRRFIRKVPRLTPHEDDIMSRAWERLLACRRKLLRSFDPKKGTFTYFMRMVGANTAWQVADLKGHSSLWSVGADVELMTGDSSGGDIERIIANRELLDRVDARLRRELSERELVILEQVIVFKQPAREVAESLDVSVEVVWTATTRLRKKLEHLSDELDRELSGGDEPPAPGPRLVVTFLVLLAVGALHDARREDEPFSVGYRGVPRQGRASYE